jgi:hypothetical protein
LYFETLKIRKEMNVYVVPVTADEIDEQHETEQRQSREYLARLNKTSDIIDDVAKAEEEILPEAEASAATEEVEDAPGTNINEMPGAQTLESALRASSTESYAIPTRFSAFRIKAQSSIDGAITRDPPKVRKHTDWQLTYTIDDYEEDSQTRAMFASMLKKQDSAPMGNWAEKKLRDYYDSAFFQTLMQISQRGALWRQERDRLDRESGRETVVFEPKG